MTDIQVDAAARTLTFGEITIPCAIGRSGACPAIDKREGDGCTPLGNWPLRTALFRPGRAAPPPGMALPWRWTALRDGWSDDPADPAYNRPVRLPHGFSAEKLQRDDPLYDIILVLGHNDAPPVPDKGSAIFFHIWNDGQPTEGCVAIARDAMDRILPSLRPGDRLDIS
ncbi:L,D-transpeptidase catalytic domain [Parasphingorhabdus marina DSM 22363]|uniref:L,D-transpeptidase catalytic domain n=1 Tax=Parasphingorhabdus marina DSM 22363 TaxID=1123272 RepID=A0A1N6H7F9_9SPHN|nr:L,D-transpeptidase family protein [Parasphingorhabdus marina]SIO15724.1 L,D-transpeptidase catalytic domain [Parasphingorhabdus marina DSM 22363]